MARKNARPAAKKRKAKLAALMATPKHERPRRAERRMPFPPRSQEMKMEPTQEAQEAIDRFYFKHGPCCAGCDWWRSISASTGDCTKAAPISGDQRLAMLGIGSCSLRIGAGHPITHRAHHCGDFKDDFDWCSLPLGYRKRVGYPASRPSLINKTGKTLIKPEGE